LTKAKRAKLFSQWRSQFAVVMTLSYFATWQPRQPASRGASVLVASHFSALAE